MKSVLIADDHEVTRRGLREILCDAFPGVEVGEVADGEAAMAQLRARPWNLLILDILMPGSNVIDVLTRVRTLDAGIPILVLTALTELEYVFQTMKAGANGVIHKHRASTDLILAVRSVAEGGSYLHPDTAIALAKATRAGDGPKVHEALSQRELAVFRLIATGRGVKEIGGQLGISAKTVATYLARIREKTGLNSYVEIARYALKNGVDTEG